MNGVAGSGGGVRSAVRRCGELVASSRAGSANRMPGAAIVVADMNRRASACTPAAGVVAAFPISGSPSWAGGESSTIVPSVTDGSGTGVASTPGGSGMVKDGGARMASIGVGAAKIIGAGAASGDTIAGGAGAMGAVGATTEGAAGGTGGAAGVGVEMLFADCVGLTVEIGGVDTGVDAHVGARFHVHTHPWIPVLIVCVVPPPVVPPHVQVQFQIHTDGAAAEDGAVAVGGGATAAGAGGGV